MYHVNRLMQAQEKCVRVGKEKKTGIVRPGRRGMFPCLDDRATLDSEGNRNGMYKWPFYPHLFQGCYSSVEPNAKEFRKEQ